MHLISECKLQNNDKESEYLIGKLYDKYISKREYEFAIATNSLKYCKNNERPKGHGFPDYLLSINRQLIIAEVTTAHDLDGFNVVDQFMEHKEAGFISGGLLGKISARVYNKIISGNFKQVKQFHLPIILIICKNSQSSFIDSTQIDCFLNGHNRLPQNIREAMIQSDDYWVIEKIPRHELISGILFIEFSFTSDIRKHYIESIEYFPAHTASIKIASKIEKVLEKPKTKL